MTSPPFMFGGAVWFVASDLSDIKCGRTKNGLTVAVPVCAGMRLVIEEVADREGAFVGTMFVVLPCVK